MKGSVPPELAGARPTSRLVYLALEAAGESRVTIAELVERTGSAESAVKGALRELREADVVEREVHPTDGRSVLYSTAEGEA